MSCGTASIDYRNAADIRAEAASNVEPDVRAGIGGAHTADTGRPIEHLHDLRPHRPCRCPTRWALQTREHWRNYQTESRFDVTNITKRLHQSKGANALNARVKPSASVLADDQSTLRTSATGCHNTHGYWSKRNEENHTSVRCMNCQNQRPR